MFSPSYREISRGCADAIHAALARPAAEILDGPRVEPRHPFLLQGLDQGRYDAGAKIGARLGFFAIRVLHALRHPHDIADRNAPPLARQAIAAARPAHALQDSGAHQLLHHLLEIALWHA